MNPTSTLALALSLLVVTSSHASPERALARAFERVAASSTRTLTFFQELAALDDCDVGGEQLQSALRRSGLEPDGLLGAFVGGLTRIQKHDRALVLTRARIATVETGSGLVEVGEEVAFWVDAVPADGVTLIRFRGARAGLGPQTLIPVRSLILRLDAAGTTYASLNVGYALLSKTVEVALARTQAGLTGAIPR